MAEITAEFLTYHHSGNDLHIRTTTGVVLYIDKSQPELITLAKTFKRGQAIRATGEYKLSSTLSNEVLEINTLERA